MAVLPPDEVVTRPNGFVAVWRAAGRAVDDVIDEARRNTAGLWAWWEQRRFLRLRLPWILVVGLAIAYFATFEYLVWMRHAHYGTFDYDLGMYDQGIWQLSRGRGFMTVRGMHVFGHHANIGYLLLVPFYWIGIGGPQFLDFVNTLAVVSVALPLFMLAWRHLRSAWAGCLLVLAYFLHFAPQWMMQETFHPECIAAPFLVGAFYLASVSKWRGYWACIAMALLWKEDVALAVAMLGLAVGLIFRRPLHGGITLAVAAGWFLIATKLIMAKFAPDGAVFDSLFGPLGASADELVRNSVTHPSRLTTTLHCHGVLDGKLRSVDPPVEGVLCPSPTDVLNDRPPNAPLPARGLLYLLRPFGFTSVLNPPLLAVGAPQHVVNYSTTAYFTWDLRWHYAMFPFLGALLSSAWTVVRRKRAVFAWMLIAVMVVASVLTRGNGAGPWTENYRSGWWPLASTPLHDDYDRALAKVPDGAAVTASYFLVPHLSQREYIYTFPNPWRGSNYGAGGTNTKLPDPNSVDYLVVNRIALNDADRALFDAIADSGQFRRVFRRTRDTSSDVLVLRRVKEGRPIPQPAVLPTTTTTTTTTSIPTVDTTAVAPPVTAPSAIDSTPSPTPTSTPPTPAPTSTP